MYSRDIAQAIERYKKFPVVAILGPRQSGKTTLAQQQFPHHTFLSLDNETVRSFALEDPEHFLQTYHNEHGIILDEFQYAPKLANYIKLAVDKKRIPGYFVVTGSQNFLLNSAITESLAGRVGILTLLPLSMHEMTQNDLMPSTLDDLIFNGSYPSLYYEGYAPADLYPSYIQSYIERDIRQLINVGNLAVFQRFVQLCAGRIGQLLNIEAFASECGVSFGTIKHWLSILEASYIIFFLQPHHNNFNKRLVKTPKLYFFDTGIACSLLRINAPHVLSLSPFRGALFESFVISDLYKQYANNGQRPSLYFWRDVGGAHEVDCIIDEGISLYPVEIKSGQTLGSSFFKGLTYWNEIAQANPEKGLIVYGGTESQTRSKGNVIGWQHVGKLLEAIRKTYE